MKNKTINTDNIKKGDSIAMVANDSEFHVRTLEVVRTEKKFLGIMLDDNIVLYEAARGEYATMQRSEVNSLSSLYDLILVKG